MSGESWLLFPRPSGRSGIVSARPDSTRQRRSRWAGDTLIYIRVASEWRGAVPGRAWRQPSALSAQASGLRAQGSGLGAQGSGLRAQDSRLRTQHSGLGTRDSGLRTHDPRPTTHDPRPTTHDPRPTTHDPQPTTQDARSRTPQAGSGSETSIATAGAVGADARFVNRWLPLRIRAGLLRRGGVEPAWRQRSPSWPLCDAMQARRLPAPRTRRPPGGDQRPRRCRRTNSESRPAPASVSAALPGSGTAGAAGATA